LQKGLTLEEQDLARDPLSKEEILKLVTNEDGQMRGPIIVQGDQVIVFGYNREKLEKIFG
jgi:arsenate reductase-like glutaredoxin family protein